MEMYNNKYQKTNQSETENLSSEKVIQTMLTNAEILLELGAPEKAFEIYKQIVIMTPNATAQYNLGSLYAQGKGIGQDFLQAAYWFYQASKNGKINAERLLKKSTMDYFNEGINNVTYVELYQKMQQYIILLYPKENRQKTAAENLYSLGMYYFNNEEYAKSAKFLRTAAQYYNHGESQNRLAVLYNAGAGLEKDDMSALYWFDRAADNGIEISRRDRDGILNAYADSLSAEEFFDLMEELAEACITGTENIPKDYEKADYWRSECERKINSKTKSRKEESKKVPKTVEDFVDLVISFLIENINTDSRRIRFLIPNTNNYALMSIEADAVTNNKLRYTVNVYRDGTDMIITNYIKSGTKSELLEYLKTENAKLQTSKAVKNLSKKVDEKW